MRTVFRIAGWLTILLDLYLLLALVATSRMKVEYHQWLPPFGFDVFASLPRIVYIGVIVWTGFLALGCLHSSKRPDHSTK